jgi:hypothetical protein
MGVSVEGIARIRHRSTGVIYQISPDELDWQESAADERQMGIEVGHVAQIDHPQLGQLTWEIWEYPIGMENHRETDIGDHVLLENFALGLAPDPDVDEEQTRIDELVEWFGGRYEDPAERTPYESAEGGYIWIWGGPHDAREVLSDNFPYEDQRVIDAAVREIESSGIVDWAPAPSPSDYDDENEDSGTPDLGPHNLGVLLTELPKTIPAARSGPNFDLTAAGRIELTGWVDESAAFNRDEQPVLLELREATRRFVLALDGTNAHQDLLAAAGRYDEAVAAESLVISRVYARGVFLENTAHVVTAEIAGGERPALPVEAQPHLMSVLDLHAAFVMADSEGRHLAEGAAAYRRSSEDMGVLRETAQQLSSAVQKAHDLFGPSAREAVAEAAAAIGANPNPQRSTQVAERTFDNLLKTVARVSITGSGAVLIHLLSEAIGASVPGAGFVKESTSIVTLAWEFLLSQGSQLQTFAALASADMSWLSQLSQIAVLVRRRRALPERA